MVKPPLRTKSIGFKVSEEEYAQLETAAQANRQTLGEWCREMILRGGASNAGTHDPAWTTLEPGTSTVRRGRVARPFAFVAKAGAFHSSQRNHILPPQAGPMPWGLERYQQTGQLHFITFSCYHRMPRLATPQARDTFVSVLQKVRQWYGFCLLGYVVMPEHVHLLMSEPERGGLAVALQLLKQIVSSKLRATTGKEPLWQARYYDFNVWSERKRVEKLRYVHRNPVSRGLVASPEEWAWSSFQQYLAGEEVGVEIESQWTARRREQLGVYLVVRERRAG